MGETSVKISTETVDYVKSRFDFASSGVEEVINRYKDLIAIEKRDLNLTKNEAMLIVDSLNSTMKNLMVVQGLEANIEDSFFYEHLDAKWEVDGKALLEKIKKYNNLQKLAILDGVEYYWQNSQMDADELLRKSGLWREEIQVIKRTTANQFNDAVVLNESDIAVSILSNIEDDFYEGKSDTEWCDILVKDNKYFACYGKDSLSTNAELIFVEIKPTQHLTDAYKYVKQNNEQEK